LNRVEYGFELSVDLPDRRLTASGHSFDEAFARFSVEVSGFAATEANEDLAAWLEKGASAQVQRTATKVGQKTIGVSSKMSMRELIDEYGQGERSAAARDLFAKGFKALDDRLDNENSKDVFDAFQAAYDALPDTPTEQWMLRLDPKAYGRAVVRAKEYGKSASNLAALCLAYALKPRLASK
jgi:hypothetical protein